MEENYWSFPKANTKSLISWSMTPSLAVSLVFKDLAIYTSKSPLLNQLPFINYKWFLESYSGKVWPKEYLSSNNILLEFAGSLRIIIMSVFLISFPKPIPTHPF